MNTIRQFFKHLTCAARQKRLQLVKQELIARKLGKLLLLVNNRPVFFPYTFQGVEVPGIDRFAEDARVEKAGFVDVRDLPAEAFNKTEEPFQTRVGEHVVNPESLVL